MKWLTPTLKSIFRSCSPSKADKTSSIRSTTTNFRNTLPGIVTAQRQKLISINNMPDHAHILIGQRPDSALSDLVGDIKSGSTNFINRNRWVKGRFSWQEGFGAFSYSHSQLGTVIRYIQNQQRHHQSRSFHDEYVGLLDKFDVSYDQRYVFKSI